MGKSLGQLAFEEDIRRYPRFADGNKRLTWDLLADATREAWEERPYPAKAGSRMEDDLEWRP